MMRRRRICAIDPDSNLFQIGVRPAILRFLLINSRKDSMTFASKMEMIGSKKSQDRRPDPGI